MNSLAAALTGSLLGTVAGGLVAGYYANRPWSVDRRARGRMALRMWRDDFYHDQRKLSQALNSDGLWWSDLEEVGRLASSDKTIGTVSEHLDGDSWKSVSGARRRMVKLENQRRADLERNPPDRRLRRSGGEELSIEMGKLFWLMESSRAALAVKDESLSKKGEGMTFNEHECAEIVRAAGFLPHQSTPVTGND